MRLRLPAGTVEKLEARVRVDGGLTDPSFATVEYALVATSLATPAPSDWQPATWAAGGRAQALVTGVAGTYRFWLRITAGAETVIRRVGIVEFS